jgi:hypothetical protein
VQKAKKKRWGKLLFTKKKEASFYNVSRGHAVTERVGDYFVIPISVTRTMISKKKKKKVLLCTQIE